MSGGRLLWEWIRARGVEKWDAGQREHGGDLRRKPVLHEAMNEMLDGSAYIAIEMQQKAMVQLHLGEALKCPDIPPAARDHILAAHNISIYGNAEGV